MEERESKQGDLLRTLRECDDGRNNQRASRAANGVEGSIDNRDPSYSGTTKLSISRSFLAYEVVYRNLLKTTSF